MKLSNKYIAFAGVALLMASCDLDKFPEGDYISEEQKEDIINGRPNLITAEVNAMAAKLNTFGTISDDATTYHNDYGIPAVFMILESGGQDLVALVNGYNWFRTSQNYSDRVYDSSSDELIWKTFYNHLKAANNVLKLIAADTEDSSLKVYRGQALAARAYDYLNLVQIYQFTYAGHENSLAVPIVTETMTDEDMQNNPRATVQQVYDQIMSDLNTAADLLTGYDNGSNKDQIDEAVVYGLRARANLLMQKWADAAKDAERAIAGGRRSLRRIRSPGPAWRPTGGQIWRCRSRPLRGNGPPPAGPGRSRQCSTPPHSPSPPRRRGLGRSGGPVPPGRYAAAGSIPPRESGCGRPPWPCHLRGSWSAFGWGAGDGHSPPWKCRSCGRWDRYRYAPHG